jgi:hypothetical protein
MQIEEQNQAAVVPEIAPQVDSNESAKSNRGGRRKGAGRKPNLAKRLLKGFTRETIALAVEDVDVKTVIIGLLKSRSDRTRLETLAFLRDTLHGRPAQSVSLSGGVNVSMAVWRPLESLTDEEIQLLDSITKKMSGQANVNALPDGRQNQTESNTAIEAELVRSDHVGQ